ncbi:hypothetical protein PV327_006168 [Microctonus hyperodae]|uniref:Uncharacterized protein n=1 Tax=Microctonus hyperodae TaxID=165561 RepID=A0AA39F3T0_MICHY|nr:hypothetical protein PV327_006168 [Microctonus hyperodae]
MEIFPKRNFIYLILFNLLIFVKVQESSSTNVHHEKSDHQNNHAELLSNVRMKIVSEHNQIEFLNLKQTNQMLANKNLPIWIVSGVIEETSLNKKHGNELKLDHEVMGQVGEFTMYQDPETTAAAVYFHHRRQFDGIIDYRYLIQELDIDLIHATDVNEFQIGESDAVVMRRKSMGHEIKDELESEDKKIAKTVEDENEEIKSEVNLNHGYPEILVIVSCEMAQELMKTEYTLTETYHEDEVEMEFVSNDKHLQSYSSSPRGVDPNRELNEAISEERREMDSQKYRYWTTGSSPSSSSSSGLLSSGESENSRMAIINSIASSYGNYGQSRSRLLSTPTPFPRLANSQENRSKLEATLYKSADALVEAQKAQIYEDIQRRIANVTSSSLNRRLWRNNSTIINNRERQHKLRMKHHRYSIKGKRNRGINNGKHEFKSI